MGNHLKMPDKRQVLALLELRHHLPGGREHHRPTELGPALLAAYFASYTSGFAQR